MSMRITVQDAEVRRVLQQLPKQIATNVRKRGMRKPLMKVRDDLRRLWGKAKFRGKAPHRRAIASATRIDIRRVQNGRIRGSVGVMYGGAGGKAAKGRQRIWHLLEDGFRHASRGSSDAYSNISQGLRGQRDARHAYVKKARKEIFERIKGRNFQAKTERRKAMQAMYASARERYAELASYTDKRRGRIAKAMSMAKRIRGRGISRGYVAANGARVFREISQSILREARAALKGAA